MIYLSRQRGGILIGALLSLAILAFVISQSMEWSAWETKTTNLDTMIESQAIQSARYIRAVDEYVADQQGGLAPTSTLVIDNALLVTDGYLPANFSFSTPFGPDLYAVAYKDATGRTRTIITESGATDNEQLSLMGYAVTTESLERLRSRIAADVQEKSGLPVGYLPANTTEVVGLHNSFTKDIADYVIARTEASSIAFLGFEDLEAYGGSGDSTDINIAPYSWEDLVEGMATNNVGLDFDIPLYARNSYISSFNSGTLFEHEIEDNPSGNYRFTFYSDGTDLRVRTECNPTEGGRLTDHTNSTFYWIRYYRKNVCTDNEDLILTGLDVPGQERRIGLYIEVDIIEPSGHSYTAFTESRTHSMQWKIAQYSISNVSIDGATLKIEKCEPNTASSVRWNRTNWIFYPSTLANAYSPFCDDLGEITSSTTTEVFWRDL